MLSTLPLCATLRWRPCARSADDAECNRRRQSLGARVNAKLTQNGRYVVPDSLRETDVAAASAANFLSLMNYHLAQANRPTLVARQ